MAPMSEPMARRMTDFEFQKRARLSPIRLPPRKSPVYRIGHCASIYLTQALTIDSVMLIEASLTAPGIRSYC